MSIGSERAFGRHAEHVEFLLATIRSHGVMTGVRFESTGTAAQMVVQAAAIKSTLWSNRDVLAFVSRVPVQLRRVGRWKTDNNDVTDKTNVFNAVADMFAEWRSAGVHAGIPARDVVQRHDAAD